ncbi:MAG: peptidoglycan editing factor PgeF [Hyphomicrobium sp.]|nr:peptidoglycan editing factor PgeF [Hyphomicrobium sp.]
MLSPITAANLSAVCAIRHGFFTRAGGVSRGIYEGLNCGLGSDDDQGFVRENRRRVSDFLYGEHGDVTTVYQEHGAISLAVKSPIPREALPKADAIVTTTPGLVIGVLTADCAPVLFADAEAKVVAAAHAGWRGAVAGIIESTILEMERQGAQRERIMAAVGPCISQAAYEVGQEFKDEVVWLDDGNSRFFKQTAGQAKPHFDLAGYVISRLSGARITNIVNTAQCTHGSESLFYSYRRSTQRQEPDYGRQISAIVVA